MRRAGVVACSSVTISFSRKSAALLWTRSFAADPEFSMTTPLTIRRSRGLRLMVSGILLLRCNQRFTTRVLRAFAYYRVKSETGGPKGRPLLLELGVS